MTIIGPFPTYLGGGGGGSSVVGQDGSLSKAGDGVQE